MAATAAELLPQFKAEAKERQLSAGSHGAKGGRGKKRNPPVNLDGRVSAKARESVPVKVDGKRSDGEARTVAAKAVGVSTGYVEQAATVREGA